MQSPAGSKQAYSSGVTSHISSSEGDVLAPIPDSGAADGEGQGSDVVEPMQYGCYVNIGIM